MDAHDHATILERGSTLEKLEAVRSLVETGGVRAGGLMARALAHEKDATVAAVLVRGLADLGLKRSLPALEKALNGDLALGESTVSGEPFTRVVVDALGRYASATSLPALARHFECPRAHRNVLLPVARLIASLGESGEFLVLRRALDLHSPLWSYAVQALAEPRFRSHASALAALLPEADAHQALLLLRTLGAMQAREQAPAVRRFLARGVIQDLLDRREAEEVLEALERAHRSTRIRPAEEPRRR